MIHQVPEKEVEVTTEDVSVSASYQFPKPWVVLLFLIAIGALALLAAIMER